MNVALSDIEKEFLGIVNELGCMSRYEAELILHRYFNCSEGQRYKILRHLTREYYITVTSDDKYLVSGNASKNNAGKLSKATIIALHIALDQIHKDKGTFDEAVRYIYKTQGGAVGFLSNGTLYKVYMLSVDSMYTIKIIEDKYKEKDRKLNNDKYAKGLTYNEISVFAFTESHRADEILEKIEEMELTIPHRIVITHNSDVSGPISYDNYDILAEN